MLLNDKKELRKPFSLESVSEKVENRSNCSSLKIEEDDEWLTTAEAAEYLKLSVGSFRNMVSDGHIPHYKLGRRNRYLRCELRNLLSAEARGRMYYDKIR